MFIRIKTSSKHGKKKVQICESIREGNKVRQVIVRHVGVAKDDTHLEELKRLAKMIMLQIKEDREGPFLFPLHLKEEVEVEETKTEEIIEKVGNDNTLTETVQEELKVDLNDLSEETRAVEGFHDIFGSLFNTLGFNNILTKKKSQVLKELILARIAHPASKHSSQEMLAADFGVDIHLDRIYRMMDALLDKRQEFEKKVFQATQSLCFGKVNMLLFDVTTLYFESVEEDELKRFGYSKDQKFHTVQVVLALATTEEGLPIGYRTFPGNTADVSTLQIALSEWQKELPIGEIRVIGDAAMMSESNLAALESANIKYVIAAKLKKMPSDIQKKLFEKTGESIVVNRESYKKQEHILPNGRRLVATYSEKRAHKDAKDRLRVLEKVQKKIGSGKNIKKLVSNRGYQKFLSAEGSGQILLDEDKISQAAQWDGLHGVITNDHESSPEEILSSYRRLWIIEESFRIHKSDLSIRPIYHFKPERVEAHILLCYLAFSLIRYTERRVKIQQEKISIQDMRKSLWRIQASVLKDHKTGKAYRVPSPLNPIARKIYQAFGVLRDQRIRELEVKV